jgi:hypothetical protein
MSKQYPKPGDRVGCVCGPSEFPRDDQGIVIATYDSPWYSDVAVVLMDSGRIMEIVGAYTKVGIGWYLLKEGVAA